jgi:hypothetical protein
MGVRSLPPNSLRGVAQTRARKAAAGEGQGQQRQRAVLPPGCWCDAGVTLV